MSNRYLGSLSQKWSKGSKVKFATNKSMAFVEDLAELAQPYGFRVHVTSAYRSPADQARVVCNNMQNTNGANLSIYGKTTRKVYRKYCPSNMSAIVEYETKKLADAIKKNPKHEGHGTGYAVDLSVYKMSYNEKVKYKKLIESMGAKVLWEKSPEHFHVVLYSYEPTDYGWTKVLAYGGLITSLGLSGLLTYIVGKRRGWWERLSKLTGSNILFRNFKE